MFFFSPKGLFLDGYHYITVESISKARVLAIFPYEGIRKSNTFQWYQFHTPCVGNHVVGYKSFCSRYVQLKSIIICLYLSWYLVQ